MIWGVGTGRCGTKSMAEDLEGLHEPKPWLSELPAHYYRGLCGSDRLLPLLKERRRLDTPAIVDLKHSYIMNLIENVDPEGEFAYVIRSPFLCIASFLAGGSWTEQDWYGDRKIQPAEGWRDETRLEKAIYHWVVTNEIIINHLRKSMLPYSMFETDDLIAHNNKHSTSPGHIFSREEADLIFRGCWKTWARAMKVSEGHI